GTSRRPRVVISPTRGPRPSTIALVRMVVPWASAEARPVSGSSMRSPLSTPPAGCAGVVGTLHECRRPDGSRATTSVNVPPTSTPTVALGIRRLARRSVLSETHVLHDAPRTAPRAGSHNVEVAARVAPDAVARANARVTPLGQTLAVEGEDVHYA